MLPTIGFIVMSTALQANPATVPVPQGGFEQRHKEKVSELSKHKFDLLMVGDSITHNFEKPEYQPIWRQFFGPRNAINLGYSGARTENIIWNLQHGELTNQSPKVITLLIGTNNADETNYPTHHTATQIAGGVRVILDLIQAKLPKTKVLLLAPFPYGERPGDNSRGIVLTKTAELCKSFADNKHVYFLNLTPVFVRENGVMNKALMPDLLHPSPTGALLWAKGMEPLLSQLMGDESRDIPTGGLPF